MVDQISRDRDVPREPIFKITDQNTAKNIDPTDFCWMKWLKNPLKAMWLRHTASKTMWPSKAVNQIVWLAALPTSPSRHSMRVMMKRHMTTQTALSKANRLIYLALILCSEIDVGRLDLFLEFYNVIFSLVIIDCDAE